MRQQALINCFSKGKNVAEQGYKHQLEQGTGRCKKQIDLGQSTQYVTFLLI